MLSPVKRDHNLAFFYAVSTPNRDPSTCGAGIWWCGAFTVGEEGRLEAQGEKLLQRLVAEEERLLGRVDEAKREAARIIEDAQRQAAAIREQASAQADRAAQSRRAEAERESEAARQEVLKKARRDVEEAEAGAQGGRDAAVKRILEQVLP